jgi:putative hydrolase of the HAD superfamily
MSRREQPTLTAIALDLGNVLVRVDHLRFCAALAEFLPLSPQQIYAAVFDSGLEPGYDTGRLSSREFYRKIMAHLGLDLPYPLFCRWWNEIFDPMEGMEETVARLADRYPLYLLSNTNPLHFHYIKERFPLLRHISRFVLSFEVGSRKPEAGIYHALIHTTGVPPERCLFIDDKLPFVEAARDHGLMAWHFTGPEDFCRRLTEHGLW